MFESTRRFYDDKVFRWSTSRPGNVFANLASILGLVIAGFAALKWDATAIPVIYLCLLSLFLITRYLRQERRARYGEAQPLLAEAYRAAQEAYEYSREGDESAGMFIDRLKQALDGFARAMTLIVGSDCRACIVEAIVDLPGSGSAVDAAKSAQIKVVLRNGYRSRETPPEEPQPVADNTDFLNVLDCGAPYFNNDLPSGYRDGNYRNSKWTAEMIRKNDFPYRATIVWPLMREAIDPVTAASTVSPPPLGFLCLDSKRRRAFHPFDSYLCGEFARTLYPHVVYLFERNRARINTSPTDPAPNRLGAATASSTANEESNK